MDAEYHLFPSPHGDKFQHLEKALADWAVKFPSPHGDKFQHDDYFSASRAIGFRPLTGINFNMLRSNARILAGAFPSPHGDKFQQIEEARAE